MRTICVCLLTILLSSQLCVGLPSPDAVSFVKGGLSSVEWAENEIHTVEHDIANLVTAGCLCEHYTCGCCSHLELAEIHLNSTVCSNVTYLDEDYGISFTVTVDNFTLYNETVSARNPPPVCMGAPFVKHLAEACVRLYDIQTTRKSLHACVRVEARMKTILLAKYDLGCFNIGNNTLKGRGRNEEVPDVLLL